MDDPRLRAEGVRRVLGRGRLARPCAPLPRELKVSSLLACRGEGGPPVVTRTPRRRRKPPRRKRPAWEFPVAIPSRVRPGRTMDMRVGPACSFPRPRHPTANRALPPGVGLQEIRAAPGRLLFRPEYFDPRAAWRAARPPKSRSFRRGCRTSPNPPATRSAVPERP